VLIRVILRQFMYVGVYFTVRRWRRAWRGCRSLQDRQAGIG